MSEEITNEEILEIEEGYASESAEEKRPAEPQKRKPEVDWKAKYDGLQGYARQQRQKVDELSAQLKALRQELEGSVTEKDSEITSLRRQLEELTGKLSELEGAKKRLEKLHDVGRKVRSQYQELQELYDDGLLRVDDLEGDELDQYLSSLSEKLRGKVGSAVKETLRGSAPPRPAGQRAGQTSNELYEQLMRMNPNSDEYRSLLDEYMRIVSQEDRE